MLILEHEGQAALSEMGEFVPDPDGAISQAEPDEPLAHSPVVSIPIDGQWQDFPSAAAAEQAAYADFKATNHRNAQNFRITDDNLGAGGAKAKYQANINAIRLLKHLEAEGLQASPEQQEILSRYVGWGGLPDAFDESKQNWAAEFRELRELLTPEEYTAARASTLNAHYTSPTVIQAIYEAVGNMGFQTGNILEPSMGVGNFFGMLPENMRGNRLYGVELDSITGRIAKQLYPKANITIAGFETTDRRDFFDLAVGNVPFGQYKVNDPAYNNSVPNCQQHCCAPRSNGSGHILPKERDHSFGHCISCQPNGAADVRSVDSRRTTRHLSFLQIHLIPAPVSSWHRGFSYKGVIHGNHTADAAACRQRAYCRNRNRRNH